MRITDVPNWSIESLNCTLTESLPSALLVARSRTHRWYGVPASAVNVCSK